MFHPRHPVFLQPKKRIGALMDKAREGGAAKSGKFEFGKGGPGPLVEKYQKSKMSNGT